MSSETPSIPEFFRDASVLVTGGSGFMGKVLIEKLLRSCPDIAKIYLLLRPKRGKASGDRIEAITRQQLFDRLRKENPESLTKLVAVSGDVTEDNLGMCDADRDILQSEVSVIFHNAASVRFDDTIQKAVKINLKGTKNVLDLALEMTSLKVILHVSTAYCNSDPKCVLEKIYPPHGDWRTMLRLCEDRANDHLLQMLAPKIIGNHPNTYTYSKSLSEQLINDYKDQLPIVIFRPSIVVSTVKEPMPGWIDNYYGQMGMMVGGGKGVLRSVYGDPNNIGDYVPVDISIKAMIVAAWEKAVNNSPSALPVYNCCSMTDSQKLSDFIALGTEVVISYPLEDCLWLPSATVIKNKLLYVCRFLLLQLLPALVMDGLLLLQGRKTMLTKLQKQIYVGNLQVSHFLLNDFHFEIQKFEELEKSIKTKDIADFAYLGDKVVDHYDFLKVRTFGVKLYLLHEDMMKLPNLRTRNSIIKCFDMIIKAVLLTFISWKMTIFVIYKVATRVASSPIYQLL